jgi:hypothetical protein
MLRVNINLGYWRFNYKQLPEHLYPGDSPGVGEKLAADRNRRVFGRRKALNSVLLVKEEPGILPFPSLTQYGHHVFQAMAMSYVI